MSFESDQRFRNWKADIDKRCQDHLETNPDEKPTAIEKFKPIRGYDHGEKTVIQVLPSVYEKGSFGVWQDGVLIEMFYGPLAQRDATSFMNKLINGDSKE